MGVARLVPCWPAVGRPTGQDVDKLDIKITVRRWIAGDTPPTAPLLPLRHTSNHQNNKQARAKGNWKIPLCNAPTQTWNPVNLTLRSCLKYLHSSTFPSHSLCVKYSARQRWLSSHFPPSKSGVGLCSLFHINRIIRWDGVGANHIFPPVSLSPKPHSQSVFTPAPLILLPFDVSCCLYKINKIYSRKMPSPTFILVTLSRPKPPKETSCHPTDHRSHKKTELYQWVLRPAPLLCSCMPSAAPYAKRAARGADRKAQWMPICRCRSRPLMHIKPTPPARRTSHPAFVVPGILIDRADRKPLSGRRRWITAPLLLAFPLRRGCTSMLHFLQRAVEYGGEAEEGVKKITAAPLKYEDLWCRLSCQVLTLCTPSLSSCCPQVWIIGCIPLDQPTRERRGKKSASIMWSDWLLNLYRFTQ